MDKRRRLLLQIMAVQFAAIDLNIYIDAQPQDMTALCIYNQLVTELMCLKDKYETEFGPLTNFGYSESGCPAGWVQEPWPWELNFV